MSEKRKNFIIVCGAAVFFFGFFVWCLFKPVDLVSNSERRPLASRPGLTAASFFSGNFMQDFEDYAADQFPLRESFRALKAVSSLYLFGQRDAGGIYLVDGYVSKLEYPLDKSSLDNAANKFHHLYDRYLDREDVRVYFSVIPDKNCFMARQNGYPSIDYGELTGYLREKTDYMQYIDISGCLELSDYYRTDTHWRQEKILDVAEKLAEEMGAALSGEYRVSLLDRPFYGVYYGQSALPLSPDQICYLSSAETNSCQVYDYETDARIPVYDMKKAHGKDPYEMFLSGSKALITIKNPDPVTDKRLIIFRDSFASSLAPLLLSGYEEITLVDIRYLGSDLLGNFVTFEDSDVLFLYSTLILNNSITLK